MTIAPYRYHAITANDTKISVSLVESTSSTLIIRSGCSEIPNNHSGTKYNSLTLHQTPNLIDRTSPNQQFQSTHPLGVRHILDGSGMSSDLFQSTHPLGVRPIRTVEDGAAGQFQSTHPLGVRPPTTSHRDKQRQFQSTHPLGVRPFTLNGLLIHLLFQSTHPLGVRRISTLYSR